MDVIGAGPCTLEHIDEQSLQEGRDCTLRKKKERKKERGTYPQPPARPREKAKDTWDNFSLNRPIFAREVDCLGSSSSPLKGLLISTFVWCQQTFIWN